MNQRDIELLSSYLDGQLKPSESARLESRLSADPGLRAVLDDLRSARSLLRQLPARKAPRNFTLTPKMVGKNPPLPRSYTAFRFVTTLASVLLFFGMGLNFVVPQMRSQTQGFGMGGGGAPEVFSAQAPAATEAPVLEAPAAEPPADLLPLPTPTVAAADSSRVEETPTEKSGVTSESQPQDQANAQSVPVAEEAAQPVPTAWLLLFAGIAVLGILLMLLMRRLAMDRWRNK